MGYAKEYSIPRAVIYDQEIHFSNPMFDLNRQIIQEEPTVVIFNERNSISVLAKILQLTSRAVDPVQQSII